MRDTYRADSNDIQTTVAAPSACPACRSADIKTTNKAMSVEAYWRCVTCGEVWNVTRRKTKSNTLYGTFGR